MSRHPSVVLLLVPGLLFLQGCFDSFGPKGGGKPGDYSCAAPGGHNVSISPSSGELEYIQLGDSITYRSEIVNRNCQPVSLDLRTSWSSSAPETLSVSPLPPSGGSARAHALRLGPAMVRLAVGSDTGKHAIRVIRRIASLQLSPASASIQVGDSVRIWSVVTDTSGAPTNVSVQFIYNTSPVITMQCCRGRGIWVRGNKPGVVTIQAHFFDLVGTTTITVVAP
jgi:hypothetical protein